MTWADLFRDLTVRVTEILKEDYLPEEKREMSAEELLEDYINSGLLQDLKALGAASLGKSRSIPPRTKKEKLIYESGKQIARQLKKWQEDADLKRSQGQIIAKLRKREIRDLRQLHKMDPQDFEYWVAGYFKRCHYRKVVVSQYVGDFGIDIYMKTSGGVPSVVQVKRYKGAVGRPVVQQTYGAMKMVGAKRCYVATNGRFTRAALMLPQRYKDIYLVDGIHMIKGVCL